jgi:hypothetical protein
MVGGRLSNVRGFADTVFNANQKKFVERAVSRTQLSRAQKQPFALEIGGAFADLGKQILAGRRHYFYIDMEEGHKDFAIDNLDSLGPTEGGYHTQIAQFPILPGSSFEKNFQLNLSARSITDIGLFSVAMYFSGQELVEFLKWAYKTLPSGGRLYLTAVSPFCNLFPGYEATYLENRARFIAAKRKGSEYLASRPLSERFPGWIPNVTTPEFSPFLPPNYLKMYPKFFHSLEPIVLSYYAKQAGFNIIRSGFLRRKFPERLIYRGERKNVGELSSLIVEKP